MRGVVVVTALAALLAVGAGGAAARPDGAAIALRPFVSGLTQPVHVAAPRNEPNRVYVVEQHGVIRVVIRGRLRAAPFLDIRHLVSSGGDVHRLLEPGDERADRDRCAVGARGGAAGTDGEERGERAGDRDSTHRLSG